MFLTQYSMQSAMFFTCSGHKSDRKPVRYQNVISSPWMSLVPCGISGLLSGTQCALQSQGVFPAKLFGH